MKAVLCVVPCMFLAGCASNAKEALTAPQPIIAPYDTRAGEVTWAVAVPMNESATSSVQALEVGDGLVAALEECRGIRCIPMNRTVQAMRDMNLPAIRTAADARQLATALGADAILVSTVTAYDPYLPEFGIAAAVFARPGAMLPQSQSTAADPRMLTRSTAEPAFDGPKSFGDRPVCVVSEHLDGRNHQVLMDLKTYALGRMQGESALGWRQYLVSMPKYTRFATYRTIDQVIQQEWIRIGGTTVAADKRSDNVAKGNHATNQPLGRQTDRGPTPEKNKRADVGPADPNEATIGAITPE